MTIYTDLIPTLLPIQSIPTPLPTGNGYSLVLGITTQGFLPNRKILCGRVCHKFNMQSITSYSPLTTFPTPSCPATSVNIGVSPRTLCTSEWHTPENSSFTSISPSPGTGIGWVLLIWTVPSAVVPVGGMTAAIWVWGIVVIDIVILVSCLV